MISTSPLRYPGGKARFTELISGAIKQSGEAATTFVEPFCGGAGVSIALLESNQIDRIALNDADPLVSSFWQVVFGKSSEDDSDVSWLISQVETTVLSIPEWKRIKMSRPSSVREAAFKCLYLNRTNFNGIIHKAGPIGGWEQKKRTLGVRFNREKLVSRIKALYGLRDHVVRIGNENWRKFCVSTGRRSGAYIYLDPPYYHKAEQLYGYVFDHKAHVIMRNYLASLKSPWMLSYDDAPEVRSLYGHLQGVHGCVIDQTYSTHPIGGARFIGRELFFSNRALPVIRHDRVHRGMSVVGTLHSVAPSVGPVRTPISQPTAQ
ncbi:MAG: DNA adenine methylase [Pseudomonadota bacterium]|nr:DNA adenine methylase [Pseudomonadota bacterium]